MKRSAPLVLAVVLSTPIAVLADMDSSYYGTCTTPASTVTITIDGNGSARNPAPCLTDTAMVTFALQGSTKQFIVMFGKNNPFQPGSVVLFTQKTTYPQNITSGDGYAFDYVACGDGGSGKFKCQDPKIIINPNQLEFIVPRGVRQKEPGTLTLKDISGSQLKIDGITSSSEAFQVAKTCDGQTLPAGGTCAAEISFHGNERQTAILTVKYEGGTQSVTVDGIP